MLTSLTPNPHASMREAVIRTMRPPFYTSIDENFFPAFISSPAFSTKVCTVPNPNVMCSRYSSFSSAHSFSPSLISQQPPTLYYKDEITLLIFHYFIVYILSRLCFSGSLSFKPNTNQNSLL